MTDQENIEISNGESAPEAGIGQRIKDLRKRHDITVDQLAALTASHDTWTANPADRGIAVSTLYLYENGSRLPRAKEIRLLCDALGVTPNYLILGKDWSMSPVLRTELELIFNKIGDMIENNESHDSDELKSLQRQAEILELKNK